MMIFDFDGTLFNTLPVYFEIQRNRIFSKNNILLSHERFISRQREHLEEYADEWKYFFEKCQAQQVYIISESSDQVLSLYLNTFVLEPYIAGFFGHRLARDGSRRRTIEELLFLGKPTWLISDNPFDLILQLELLNIVDAREFHSGGISVFRQKIVNLGKTIFGN